MLARCDVRAIRSTAVSTNLPQRFAGSSSDWKWLTEEPFLRSTIRRVGIGQRPFEGLARANHTLLRGATNSIGQLSPVQLLCFNFGATHAIHHFVVSQPFYVRQLTARTA